MRQFKRQSIVLVLVILFLGVGYVFCIPCQFFGWMPMPSVSEVLADPKIRPKTMDRAEVLGKYLCMSIYMKPLIKRNPEREFYQDYMEQFAVLDDAYQKTVLFYIDGFRRVMLFSSLMIQSKSASPCIETDGLTRGQHVAHLSFEAPLGQLHEYTWVFEIKADGIVPEVIATVAP